MRPPSAHVPDKGAANFYQRFAAAAAEFADCTAIVLLRSGCPEAETVGYGELHAHAERVAAWLAARGIASGDRCAILADNDARWVAAYLGALRLGAVAVPLDTAYSAKQIATLLADCGAKVLFTAPRFLPAVKEAARSGGFTCQTALLRGDAAGLPSLDEVLAGLAPPVAEAPSPAQRDDPAVILYTSGTTSDPKGVVLTHGNLLAEIEAVLQVIRVDHRDAILGVLPLFHALAQMANLLLPFAIGARVIYLETLNTAELLRALREQNITAFACVPQFFYLIHRRVMEQAAQSRVKRLLLRTLLGVNGGLRRTLHLNAGRLFFRPVHVALGQKMRFLVTGGSRFDPVVGRDLYRMGFDILQAYGLTECSGAATVLRPGDAHIGSAGQPLPGAEVRIGSEKIVGEASRDGEILVRGPIVMQGYYGRADVNAATLRGGWLHTGDLGYMDAAGRLYITGRKKEIIVTGAGKNIYPEEIEEHYLQSPYIKELCVIGVSRPGEPSAERLHGVVVPNLELLRERKVVNVNEILRFEIEGLSAKLPAQKRILSYEVWTDELPRTTTRKLKRFEIERRAHDRGFGGGVAAAETPPPDEEELAWSADAHVEQALAAIRAAARCPEAVRAGASLELDLGLDSMERVELLAHLEERFGVRVSDDAAQQIYTVRELVEAVRPAGTRRAVAARAGGDAWANLLREVPEDDPAFAALLKVRPVTDAVLFVLVKLFSSLARLFLRTKVTGDEHLGTAETCGATAYLICPNHQSYVDPFFVVAALPFAVFRRLFFVGASEYFETPLMRRIARLVRLIPVDPDANLVRAMQAGAFGLRHGRVLVLFPEGERSIDGTVKKLKKGAAILSLHTRAPIVPVALDGMHEVWPRGHGPRWRALLPGSGVSVRLRFGPPLAPPEPLPAGVSLTEAEAHYAAATDQLRRTVVAMWDSLRG